MKRLLMLVLFIVGCGTQNVITPPPPIQPPVILPVADISGTYSGGLEFLTCYPKQLASAALILRKDTTTAEENDYSGTVQTSTATVIVKTFYDSLNLRHTIYTPSGQNVFFQFNVTRSSTGQLVGTFSQLVSMGTCSDNKLSDEAPGNVSFVP